MKPTVDIEIKGKTYTLEATFELFSEVERITGIGLFSICNNPTSLRLDWICQLIFPFVKEDMSEDELKISILPNYPEIYAQILQLLNSSFSNPNPNVQKLKDSQTTDDPVKKN